MTTGAELIAAERERQITEEGWTPEHDAGHGVDLMDAGRAYTQSAVVSHLNQTAAPMRKPPYWPWADRYWKPTGDPVRDLVKAGALIAAAIDSIQEKP